MTRDKVVICYHFVEAMNCIILQERVPPTADHLLAHEACPDDH